MAVAVRIGWRRPSQSRRSGIPPQSPLGKGGGRTGRLRSRLGLSVAVRIDPPESPLEKGGGGRGRPRCALTGGGPIEKMGRRGGGATPLNPPLGRGEARVDQPPHPPLEKGGGRATPDKSASFRGTRAVAGRPNSTGQADDAREDSPPTRGDGAGPRPVPLEDVELIERVRNGETEAYGVLVRKYQDRVFNTCWRICGHLEDARDLTQEAFLKALEGLASFRHQSGFYTWVFRVAVNLALTHRRKTHRRRAVSLDAPPSSTGTQAETLARRLELEADHDAGDGAGDAELHGHLVKAMNHLEDDYRAVIVLRDIEGFDYGEIAEILGVPTGTVKSRLHRARAALGEAIRPVVERSGGPPHSGGPPL